MEKVGYKMDVTEIRNQRLSTILTDFMICQSCRIVDNNRERMRVGYECPRCGIPGKHGMIYFPSNVQSMIDLMQEFYHQEQNPSLDSAVATDKSGENHRLAVVIFFCTLAEVLLEHFLRKLMDEKKLPREIQDRLLDDNLLVKQRVQKLFPTLTGVKWKTTVTKLEKDVTLDFVGTIKFYQRASRERNNFLHKGYKWAITQDMPEQCIRHIWPLVSLFVALHNKHIASLNREMLK